MVMAGAGTETSTPDVGTGLGIGALNDCTAICVAAGLAPVARTVDVEDPLSAVLPRAAAAPAMLAGIVTCSWKLAMLKDWWS
jgi:hypothetical protein